MSETETATQAEVIAAIRTRVDRWRGFALDRAADPYLDEGRYEPVAEGERALTETSRELLRWWFRQEPHEVPSSQGYDRFKYWPHQRRAVETFIYLHEVCGVRRVDALWKLVDGAPDFTARDPWPKLGAQLATGAGKTKVMSLLVAWSVLNALREPDTGLGLGRHVLLLAPGLPVRDRLLLDFAPKEPGIVSVFAHDPVIPPSLSRDWRLSVYTVADCPRRLDPQEPTLVVTNIHQLFRQAEPSAPTRARGAQVMASLFEEGEPERLESGEVPLYDRLTRSRGLLVINDEAHHVWDEPGHEAYEARAKVGEADKDEDAREAMAWISALRRLHGSTGDNGRLGLQIDLSATLYEETGAKKTKKSAKTAFRPATLFRHTAVQYDLPEAIADGIVKRPVLEKIKAKKKSTGEVEPLVNDGAPNAWEKYRNLLITGIRRWRQLKRLEEEEGGKKPILFVICNDRHEAAEVSNYLRYGVASREDLSGHPLRGYTDLETGETLFVERGSDGVPMSTVTEVHIGSKERSSEKDWDKVRALVNTIDRDEIADPSGAVDALGRPVMVPNPYNVVVSVMMLKEGWDVRGVRVIVPLRPCDSRTLTEQVLGRGLRKVHPPELEDDGSAELRPEKLYVIEHPSFEAILDQIKDLVDEEDSDAITHTAERVPVTLRSDEERAAVDVRLVSYEGEAEVVQDWREGFDVRALPGLSPRRKWLDEYSVTEIQTWLREAMKGGETEGQSFELPVEPSYRDFDHLLDGVYVFPLLRSLHKSYQHQSAVRAVVREYLERKVFDFPASLPLSFERALAEGEGRIAMANLARPELRAAVFEALKAPLETAMNRRLPSSKPLLHERRASELQPYQAPKKNVYEPTKRSVFVRAAMDSADERKVALLLDGCVDVVGWVNNHRRVGYSIGYEWQGRQAKYIPDFVARARIGAVEHHVIVEVKGRFDDRDKAKAVRGAGFAELLTLADGRPWHYVFLVENASSGRTDISWWSKQSVTSMADLLRHMEALPLIPPSGSEAKITPEVKPDVPPEERHHAAWPVVSLDDLHGKALAEAPVRGWLRVGAGPRRSRDLVAVRVPDAAMEPGLPEGAWVLVRPHEAPRTAVALDQRRVLVRVGEGADARVVLRRWQVEGVGEDGRPTGVVLRADGASGVPAERIQEGAVTVLGEVGEVVLVG